MRILHANLRVSDMRRSIDFYTSVLGMKVLRRRTNPDRLESDYTFVFLGYADEAESTVLELTYDRAAPPPEPVDGFHVAFAVPDAAAICRAVCDWGCTVLREPDAGLNASQMVIALLRDPDGYELELIERA